MAQPFNRSCSVSLMKPKMATHSRSSWPIFTLVICHGLHPSRDTETLSSRLTHCLRAWFLLLKYKMSFFLIAWFLRHFKKERDGGNSSREKEAILEHGMFYYLRNLFATWHILTLVITLLHNIIILCMQKYNVVKNASENKFNTKTNIVLPGIDASFLL